MTACTIPAVTMEVTYEFKNPDWTLVWAQPGEFSSKIDARYGAVYCGDTGQPHRHLGDGQGTAPTEGQGVSPRRAMACKAFKARGISRISWIASYAREADHAHGGGTSRGVALHARQCRFQLQRKLEWDPVNERFPERR